MTLSLLDRGPCPPHKFANDYWPPQAVDALDAHLRNQEHVPEHAAAVVFGAGALPYMYSQELGVSVVYDVDLDEGVLDVAQRRTALLQSHADWDRYHIDGIHRLCDTYRDADDYVREQERVIGGGLQRSFEVARHTAASIEFRPRQGDIQDIAEALGREAVRDGHEVTFVNATNLAAYIGYKAMYESLAKLPLAEDVVIADSVDGLCVRIYTLDEYRARAYPVVA